MLFTGQSTVAYWELPPSGVRLNGAKVEQDDGQLIREACQGDTAAFGVLVRKYQARLCTSLTHICGSLDDAEDVAQEAFVQAYVKLRTFAGGSAFYTWLYRIAVNAAISRRRRRRELTSVDSKRDELGLEPLDDGEQADERLLREERAVQVQHALSRLSEEHRTILVLREIDDCDYDQIAQILQLPVGTVRSRLHRARLQLKEQLDEILSDRGLRGKVFKDRVVGDTKKSA
jgi:RNA polymerase sigma-70 factor, ECF subfamily